MEVENINSTLNKALENQLEGDNISGKSKEDVSTLLHNITIKVKTAVHMFFCEIVHVILAYQSTIAPTHGMCDLFCFNFV